tara:strand:+ start:166 stop:945 length:780 start_codon:yes stop_codon:yes gene_type:complete
MNVLLKLFAAAIVSANGSTRIVSFASYNYRHVARMWCDRLVSLGYRPKIVALDAKMSREPLQCDVEVGKAECNWNDRKARGYLWQCRLVYAHNATVGGQSILLSDVDTIWMRHVPLDTWAQHDVYHSLGNGLPRDVWMRYHWVACMGITIFRATPRTQVLLSHLVHGCKNKHHRCDDQAELNHFYVTQNLTWVEQRPYWRTSTCRLSNASIAVWNASFVIRNREARGACNAWIDAPNAAPVGKTKLAVFERHAHDCPLK